VAGFANPSAASLAAGKIPFFSEMSHSMSQKPIGFGLISATVGFEPCDDVGIQAHRHGLLRWPIELADFGAAPINDRRRIRKINVLVSFCDDDSEVSLLLLCELPHRLSFRGTRQREPR
jgi:hypothetical protein